MSNELETLAARMELSPLMRTHGGLVLSREAKEAQVSIRRAVCDTVVAEVKASGLKRVAGHAMRDASDLDDLRNDLAGGDPTKNSVLAGIEAKYVRGVGNIIDGLTDPFKI